MIHNKIFLASNQVRNRRQLSCTHRCTFLDHQNLLKIIQMYHG